MEMDNTHAPPTTGLRRPQTGTWSLLSPTERCIRDFLKGYKESEAKNIAKHAAKLIQKELNKEARKPYQQRLEAKVSFRGKTKDSLRNKLLKKANEQGMTFAIAQDILDNIDDFAGVRVILYMPSKDQRDKADHILRTIWKSRLRRKDRTQKSLRLQLKSRTDNPTEYQRIHRGYDAEHYVANMSKRLGSDSFSAISKDKVEIQVISAMSHAWSEAEHDVAYKSEAYGKASEQELRILDALKGQVQTADLLLEHFYHLFTTRLYQPFKDWTELRNYIKNLDISKKALSGPCENRHFKVLFRLLVCLQQNCPIAMITALRELGFPDESSDKISTIINEFPSLRDVDLQIETNTELRLVIALIHQFVNKQKRELGGIGHRHQNESDSSTSSTEDHDDYETSDNNEERKIDAQDEDMRPEPCTRVIINFLLTLRSLLSSSETMALLRTELSSLTEKEDQQAVTKSINWILGYKSWEFVLGEDLKFVEHASDRERGKHPVRDQITPCWNWFELRAQHASSFLGFIFNLVHMGFTMDLSVKACIEKMDRIPLIPEQWSC